VQLLLSHYNITWLWKNSKKSSRSGKREGGSEIGVEIYIRYNVLERDDDKLNETLQAITVREMGNVLKTDIGAIS
jgi:hypothetical protein